MLQAFFHLYCLVLWERPSEIQLQEKALESAENLSLVKFSGTELAILNRESSDSE